MSPKPQNHRTATPASATARAIRLRLLGALIALAGGVAALVIAILLVRSALG